jgi:hypothetical protein
MRADLAYDLPLRHTLAQHAGTAGTELAPTNCRATFAAERNAVSQNKSMTCTYTGGRHWD